MKPRWMRRHAACPDCGLIVHIRGDTKEDAFVEFNGQRIEVIKGKDGPFDCPRCKAHYTQEDFWDENQEKWSTEHKEE